MDTTREKLIARIQKLLALTVERGATAEEAATAAAKVQAILLEHNLSVADVTDITAEAPETVAHEDVPMASRNDRILMTLLHVLAKYNFCDTVYCPSAKKSVLFGKPSNLEVVKYLHAYLCRALRSESVRSYRAGAGVTVQSWRHSFLCGAVSAINVRLREARAAQEAQHAANGAAVRSLVVASDKLVTAAVAAIFPHTTKSTANTRAASADGYAQGQSYGRSVGLHAGIGASGASGAGRMIR